MSSLLEACQHGETNSKKKKNSRSNLKICCLCTEESNRELPDYLVLLESQEEYVKILKLSQIFKFWKQMKGQM